MKTYRQLANYVVLFLSAMFLLFIGQMIAYGASPPGVVWQNHYGTSSGNGGDYCTSSIQTLDGGRLLIGYSYAGPSGEVGLIIRIDVQGVELWRHFYGTNSQYGYLVDGKQLPDGGFVLVGAIAGSGGFGAEDGWILIISAQGDVLWEKRAGGASTDAFNSVIVLPDGGFVAIGVSISQPSGNKTSPSYGNGDGWVAWLDSQGNAIRDRSYGGDKTDQFTDGFQNDDGNLVFGGYSYSGTTGNKTSANRGGADYWFVCVDITGITILRDKNIGGGYDDKLFDLVPTTDGGLVGVGYSNSGATGDKTSASFGYQDGWVVKLDANWTISWETSLGGSNDDFFNKGLQVFGGGIVVVGGSYSDVSGNKTSPNFGWEDGLIAKLNPTNGVVLWDMSLGTADTEEFTTLQVNVDGGLFLGGWSWAFSDGGFYAVQLASPPPTTLTLSVMGLGTNSITVRLSGPVGLYQIQTSTDLVDWSTLTSVSIDESGVGSFTDPQSDICPSKFYRAVKMN